MSRITFRAHIPNFVSGVEPEVFRVDNVEELLNKVEFKNITTYKSFSRFSEDKYPFARKEDGSFIPGCHIMAEFDQGKRWHVVGTVDVETLGLPQWKPGVSLGKEEV